ncbi:hypothetical protein [Rhodococcus tukisamuensis]|uniref:Antitoxin Xre/MbcA/ParS-like toxin-binding domain-containing protein n=1 Tax=Rhodococcus tukisamuensis TaxID=168276 RepID=A0A1G6ULG7_9NOCA|nr:hypothetical protein [Rhodococcus tukisamuensis]SDD42129.1 hypothetical protein SAMN05444580_104229 [Rhodococcus tukisamuensis]
MSSPLTDVMAAEIAASGIDETELNQADVQYVEHRIRDVLSGLKARRVWENHIGPILTHKQTLEVTGWTKQALSQAVRDRRVLRLEAEDGTAGYSVTGFDDAAPAKPIPGIKEVLRAWSHADPQGWTVASWLMTEQPELGGRTPRESLLGGDATAVVALARQAADRLAA